MQTVRSNVGINSLAPNVELTISVWVFSSCPNPAAVSEKLHMLHKKGFNGLKMITIRHCVSVSVSHVPDFGRAIFPLPGDSIDASRDVNGCVFFVEDPDAGFGNDKALATGKLDHLGRLFTDSVRVACGFAVGQNDAPVVARHWLVRLRFDVLGDSLQQHIALSVLVDFNCLSFSQLDSPFLK
jgi:hypothetical protein